jgi:hypothetical protein
LQAHRLDTQQKLDRFPGFFGQREFSRLETGSTSTASATINARKLLHNLWDTALPAVLALIRVSTMSAEPGPALG